MGRSCSPPAGGQEARGSTNLPSRYQLQLQVQKEYAEEMYQAALRELETKQAIVEYWRKKVQEQQ